MTQTQQVLEYIKTRGSIDAFRAFTELGILRLGARIYDLRRAGVELITITKTRRTEAGVKTWAEYRLKENRSSVSQTEERREGGEVAQGISSSEDTTTM